MLSTIQNTDPKRLSFLVILLLCFVWGTTHIAVKYAIQTIPVFFMAGIREFFASLIFLSFSLWLEKPRNIDWKEVLRQGLFGLGFFAFARGLMVLGLNYAPAGLVSLVFSLIPVYVLGINLLMGKGRINKRILTGLLLGALGMFLVFRESLFNLKGTDALLGMAIALGGAVCWAGTSVLLTEGREGEMPAMFRSAVQLFFGAMGLLLVSGVLLEPVDFSAFSGTSMLGVAYLVIFGSIAGFGSYVYAIKHLPVAQVTLYAYINPFVALFFGWLLLGELLTLELLLSFGVTLAGVWLLSRNV
ncbi:MAG: EamA family transporter [Phaeodactylibacter sp.]|nr:EamA family transporter [Phaeodactylibacter sp.]